MSETVIVTIISFTGTLLGCSDKARIMEGLRDEEVLSVGTGRVS